MERCMNVLRVGFVVAVVVAACTPPAPPEAPGGTPGTVPAVSSAGSAGDDGLAPTEGAATVATTWKVVDQGVSVPDAWRTCSAASDCALVRTTCCDQCNGGKVVAVATSHVKDAEARYPHECKAVGCTMRGCSTRAACETNRCVMEWENLSP
jgi:hypothetical protein